MMVKLWNDGNYTHKEKFRDEIYEIPAHGFIEMDEEKAHLFCGQYYPPAFDADGNMIPIALNSDGKPIIGKAGFKMLRIERTAKDDASKQELRRLVLKCQMCGFEAHGAEELDDHILAMHEEQMADKDAREELTKKRRGRPPKGESVNA